MENRYIFRELLSELRAAADESGGIITKDRVHEMLADMPLTEEHFAMIYDYLGQQNIRVADSEEEAQEQPEDQEQRSLSMYIEDLMQLDQEIFEDEHELIRSAASGDLQARQRLIEGYLPRICEMAGEYEGDELAAEDLIQEGNLGLLTALETLGEFDSPAACRAHLLNGISHAMDEAIRGGQETRRLGEGLLSRVNHLNEAVHNLERDLGHKVSAAELSAYLDMPLEEISDLLRMSGDQIELEGGR